MRPDIKLIGLFLHVLPYENVERGLGAMPSAASVGGLFSRVAVCGLQARIL